MFRFFYSVLVLLIVCLLVYVHLLPAEDAKVVLKEGGPVEMLSALGWFLAAAVLAVVSSRAPYRDGFIGAFLLVLFGLRELDFQKRFTTMSISKTKFFVHPDVPWTEKAIVTAFILLVLYFFAGFVRRNIRPFIALIRRKSRPAMALLGFFLLLPVSKMLDRIPNALKESGILLHSGIAREVGRFEEIGELGLPFFLILVIAHFAAEIRGKRHAFPTEIAGPA